MGVGEPMDGSGNPKINGSKTIGSSSSSCLEAGSYTFLPSRNLVISSRRRIAFTSPFPLAQAAELLHPASSAARGGDDFVVSKHQRSADDFTQTTFLVRKAWVAQCDHRLKSGGVSANKSSKVTWTNRQRVQEPLEHSLEQKAMTIDDLNLKLNQNIETDPILACPPPVPFASTHDLTAVEGTTEPLQLSPELLHLPSWGRWRCYWT
ncbi:hypothetical protein OPV22_000259 [Ensete ventricosum]|uniref:Uncharacterized protein n=1 Tax=Ensete ventricosum TaxID=4639 RepID=A0AAV8QA76_ENSVE|nr:hypothetical protein OPV22_000259 [Ensete ventricosum]